MASSKRIARGLVLLVASFTILSACGSPSGAPPAQVPIATGDPAARWAQIVQAANQEGTLALLSHTFLQHRYIVEQFQAAYPEIKVEHTAIRPSDVTPRVITEQRGGIYTFDAWLSPTSNMHNVGIPAGIFSDMTPFLIRPEVTDGTKWRGGRLLYTSGPNFDEPLVAINSMGIGGEIYVNRNVLPASVFNNERQLNDPRFRGQIGIREYGQPHLGSFILSGLKQAYGEDFVRTILLDQNPVLNPNARLLTDQLISGRYGVLIGGDNATINTCFAERACDHIEKMTTRTYASTNGVSVFKNPAHPNAAAVFVNWFLGPEGQRAYVDSIVASEDPPWDTAHSARTDVEPHADAVRAQTIADYTNPRAYSQTSAGDTSNLEWVIEFWNSRN